MTMPKGWWTATLTLATVLAGAVTSELRAEERAIRLAGSMHYDAGTLEVWPRRLQLIADGSGRVIPEARRRAAEVGNPIRFIMYLSFSSLDGGCGCFDADLLARLRREHPEFVLRDDHRVPVSTFVNNLGAGRQLAMDIGNPAYVAAWASAALEAMERSGWDGLLADNFIRGRFPDPDWSAVPISPRSGKPYTVPEYRQDMLSAAKELRRRLDAAHKIVVGNQGGAWLAFEDDPTMTKIALALGGIEVEDFVYDYGGNALSEDDWLRQLRYLDALNRGGVLTYVHGGGGALMEPAKREYVVASYLLTREGQSVVGDLNAVRTWWPPLTTELGAALGPFYCLDPQRNYARAGACHGAGYVFVRDFARAAVFVNPGTAPRSVPVGGDALRTLDGDVVQGTLVLPPQSGRIAVRIHATSPGG